MANGGKIVAIGPREEIMGLRSVGMDLIAAENASELGAVLPQQALDPAVRLILVSETVADEAQATIAELRERGGAVIMLVPSHRGPKHLALQWIKRAMEQSIGVDMISKD